MVVSEHFVLSIPKNLDPASAAPLLCAGITTYSPLVHYGVEADFFQVSGMGGTMASCGFRLALRMLQEHYNPARYNSYLFYASDGDNFSEDRATAAGLLGQLGRQLNYLAYVETLPGMPRAVETEMQRLWRDRERQGMPLGSATVHNLDDVLRAVRQFLTRQATA